MNPTHTTSRRRHAARFAPELLESRELLTGGAGNTFAMISGAVTQANTPVSVSFTINPSQFKMPKGKFTLGIDIVPASGGNLAPLIAAVDDPNGKLVPQTFHSVYAPHLPSGTVAAGSATSAVLAPVHINYKDPTAPVTYTVSIVGLKGTTGNFLLGFYLPGDVNGVGSVTKADLSAVKAVYGSTGGSTKYNFNADVNRDGRIGGIDLAFTRQNLGVSTTVNPSVSSNLDPASVNTMTARETTYSSVHFTGQASPGAKITYSEINGNSPTETTYADASGNYSINTPLGPGSNTFSITAQDEFGQTISGELPPVLRLTQPSVTLASLSPVTKQANGGQP